MPLTGLEDAYLASRYLFRIYGREGAESWWNSPERLWSLSGISRSRLEMVRLAREWRYWSKKLAEAARRVLGGCEVHVFGSVAEGRAVGGSDVDIPIVSDGGCLAGTGGGGS